MKRESFPMEGVTLTSIRITQRGTTVACAETTQGAKITYMFRDAEPRTIAELRRIIDNEQDRPCVEWTST